MLRLLKSTKQFLIHHLKKYNMIKQADKDLKSRWLAIFNALSLESRKALKSALQDLHEDSLRKANYSWTKHKAPMALYWKVVGVYAGHLAKSIKLM